MTDADGPNTPDPSEQLDTPTLGGIPGEAPGAPRPAEGEWSGVLRDQIDSHATSVKEVDGRKQTRIKLDDLIACVAYVLERMGRDPQVAGDVVGQAKSWAADRVGELEAALRVSKGELSAAQEQHAAQIADLQARLQQGSEAYQQLQQLVAELRANLDATEKEATSFRARADEAEANLDSATARADAAEVRANEADARATNAQALAEDADARRALLEDELERVRARAERMRGLLEAAVGELPDDLAGYDISGADPAAVASALEALLLRLSQLEAERRLAILLPAPEHDALGERAAAAAEGAGGEKAERVARIQRELEQSRAAFTELRQAVEVDRTGSLRDLVRLTHAARLSLLHARELDALG